MPVLEGLSLGWPGTSTVPVPSYNRRVDHGPEAATRGCRGSLSYISSTALTTSCPWL